MYCKPKKAVWHRHVNGVGSPEGLTSWLKDRSSLTAKLTARCGQFRVERLHQRQAVCLADEFEAIGLRRQGKVYERDVILRCAGHAMVYGHTVVPLHATAEEWPLFAGLGERSLGSTLFNDPLVQRDELAYARLQPNHPLMQRIARGVLHGRELPTHLYARRSVFRRKGGCLLVTEVFLPQDAFSLD